MAEVTPTSVVSSEETSATYESELKAPVKLSKWLKIAVREPTRRSTTTMKIQDSYVVYMIETKISDKSLITKQWADDGEERANFPDIVTVWRRYSEFDVLRDYLIVTFPAIIIPPLPEKRTVSSWQVSVTDKTDPEFVERRRVALEQFLTRLTDIPEIGSDAVLLGFLNKENDWKELVSSTNYQSMRDSRIRELSAGYRIKRPNQRFEVAKKYATDLETNLNNILKVRAKTAEHLYGIHKIHTNYGREFSQWSSVERPDMAEGLQKIGHFMDTFAEDVDVAVENEEDFADQLKEYYGFCDSIKHLCKKQEVLQLQLEQAEDQLEAKKTERDNFSQGKMGLLGGLKAKMFGGMSGEQREEKLKAMDEQILDLEEKVKTLTEGLEQFETAALANIELFHQRKAQDVTEMLINFLIMTLDRCKRSRATWSNIKEICDSM